MEKNVLNQEVCHELAFYTVPKLMHCYCVPGYAGVVSERCMGIVSSAYADYYVDEDSVPHCTNVCVYVYGDARLNSHYYGENCVEFSHELIDYMKGHITRESLIEEIANKIQEAAANSEEE